MIKNNVKLIFECVTCHYVKISYFDFVKFEKSFSNCLIVYNDHITVLKNECFSCIDKNDIIYCNKNIVEDLGINYD